MKTKYVCLILALLAVVLTSCQKEEIPCGCDGGQTYQNTVTTVTIPAGTVLIPTDPGTPGNGYNPGDTPPAIAVDINGDGFADGTNVAYVFGDGLTGLDRHQRVHNVFVSAVAYFRQQYGISPMDAGVQVCVSATYVANSYGEMEMTGTNTYYYFQR